MDRMAQRWNATGEIVELFTDVSYNLDVLVKNEDNTLEYSNRLINVSPKNGYQILQFGPVSVRAMGRPVTLILTDMTDYTHGQVKPLKLSVVYSPAHVPARVDFSSSFNTPVFEPLKRSVQVRIPSFGPILISFNQ